MGPRFRGDDSEGDFHSLGWAKGRWKLPMKSLGRPRHEGGVKPPHSKALRAFSSFIGARRPTGMRNGFGAAPIPNLN